MIKRYARIVNASSAVKVKKDGCSENRLTREFFSFERYFSNSDDYRKMQKFDDVLNHIYGSSNKLALVVFDADEDSVIRMMGQRGYSSYINCKLVDIKPINGVRDVTDSLKEEYTYIPYHFIETVLLEHNLIDIKCNEIVSELKDYKSSLSYNGTRRIIRLIRNLGEPIKPTKDIVEYINSYGISRFSESIDLLDVFKEIQKSEINENIIFNPKNFSNSCISEIYLGYLVNVLIRFDMLNEYLNKAMKVKTIAFRKTLSKIFFLHRDVIKENLGDNYKEFLNKYSKYVVSCKKYTGIPQLLSLEFEALDESEYNKDLAKNIIKDSDLDKEEIKSLIKKLGGEIEVPEHVKMYLKYMKYDKDDVAGPFAYIQMEDPEKLEKYAPLLASAFLYNYSNNRGDTIYYIKGIWNEDNINIFMKYVFKEMELTKTTSQLKAMLERFKGSSLKPFISKVELFNDCEKITKIYVEKYL